MKETVDFLARHGYWLLAAAMLGRQACLPVPANLFLIAAGALARSGKLSLPAVVTIAVMTLLLADFGWYGAGRRWGDRTVHFLGRLSRHSGSLVEKATRSFAKHGTRTLLISKFILGLDAVAVPLTGAGGTPLTQFALFDAFGALLWSCVYCATGYIFSNQLDLVAVHVARLGALFAIAAAAACGFYFGRKLVHWFHCVITTGYPANARTSMWRIGERCFSTADRPANSPVLE